MVAPSRAEPGCLCYLLHESKDAPGVFVFYEQWASQAAFDEHLKMPAFATLSAKLAGRSEPPAPNFLTPLA